MAVPTTVNGVRTIVIPTTARAVALESAPQTALEAESLPALARTVLSQAVTTKQQIAQSLLQQNPAYFGVGVGQSLDNPKEAALVIYVDRRKAPAQLPATVDGLRARYVVMDRLHVTRAYAKGLPARSKCLINASAGRSVFDAAKAVASRGLNLR